MASFSYDPVWTQNHGFTIGTEVNFSQNNDSAESLTNIPFGIKGLWILGGNVNYNILRPDSNTTASGQSTLLLRISICGDPAGGDAGGGPGSVVIASCAIYVRGDETKDYCIPSSALLLENGGLPVPPDGGPYQMHMKADIAGSTGATHMEIALSGMWR